MDNVVEMSCISIQLYHPNAAFLIFDGYIQKKDTLYFQPDVTFQILIINFKLIAAAARSELNTEIQARGVNALFNIFLTVCNSFC